MKKANLKHNVIANYIGQFYSIFIGIFLLPFYLKYLGAESYGLVGFFTMLTSWMMLLDAGLSPTLSRESARLKDKPDGLIKLKKLVRSIEALFFIISIAIFLIIFHFSSFIAQVWLDIKELSPTLVADCIKIMGVMVALRWFVSFYQGCVIGFEQQVWLNIYKVVINTLKFVGAFLLIKYVSNDIWHFFIYQFFIALIEFFVIRYKAYSMLPKGTFILPSIAPLKEVAPFALSIAYTAGIWTIFTQLDKLLLSHYIPLSEYGYFTLVVVISGAILQLSNPINQAILPRMTSLLSNNKEKEMLDVYHKSTQFISIFIFSVVAIVGYFSYELLYAWTGDEKASSWAAPILFWYALGNGILSILAFQYFLQFAYGNLKYHVRFNTIFPLIALPVIFYAISNFGAIGAAITWFLIQLVTFLIWPPFVHSKFAPTIHKDWILKDILPSLLITVIFVVFVSKFGIDFSTLNRFEIILTLFGYGAVLLILNALAYKNVRVLIKSKILKRGV